MKKSITKFFTKKEGSPERGARSQAAQNSFSGLSPDSQVLYANSKKLAVEIDRRCTEQQVYDVYGSPARKSRSPASCASSTDGVRKAMYFFPSPGSSDSAKTASFPGIGPGLSPTRKNDPWGGSSPTGRPGSSF